MDNSIQTGSRTINGKALSVVMDELLNLISLDDYSTTENGNPYINTDMLMRKLRKVVGFNLQLEPIALEGGKFVEPGEVAGKQIISTAMRLNIYDDAGMLVTSVAKIGTAAVTFKKDGGVLSIENDVKMAESDSFKRGVFTLCPKPEGYDEKFKPKKVGASTSSNYGNSNATDCGGETLAISKAFSVLKNGMIAGGVVRNGQPIDAVAFSSEVQRLASACNMQVAQLPTLLKAGAQLMANCKNDTYNGNPRVILNQIALVKAETPSKQVQPQQPQKQNIYEGTIRVVSKCTVSEDGVALRVIKQDNTECTMYIKNDVLECIGKACKITAEQVVASLDKGLNVVYKAKGVVASNGDLLLEELKGK